jgi:hypothetical protein
MNIVKITKVPSYRFVTAVRGVYASGAKRAAPGPDVTTPQSARDQTVTEVSVPYAALARRAGRRAPGLLLRCHVGEPAAIPDRGQLIFTLVPVPVSLIWTSSASPAITASEKPGGISAASP